MLTKPLYPKLAKSEHPHPLRTVKTGHFGAENGMKTALKNGAYPFKTPKSCEICLEKRSIPVHGVQPAPGKGRRSPQHGAFPFTGNEGCLWQTGG